MSALILRLRNKLIVKAGGKVELMSGATLDIKDGATVTGLPSAPDAGADTKGLVKQGVAVADAAGEYVTAAEFKAALDSLRGGGIIATAAAEAEAEGET